MRICLKIAVLVAPLLLLGAGCALPQKFFPNGRVVGTQAKVTCDYQGQTYDKGTSRSADDGCNICTCGDTGWACSQMKCAALSQTEGGIIRGTLGSPDGGAVPAQRVCAENYLSNSQRCVSTATGASSYEIRMPLGTWWVSAEQSGVANPKKAWATVAGDCRSGSDCRDHSLVSVTLSKNGDVAVANPDDWGMVGSVASFDIIPSKRMDVLFYYPDSAFEARTVGAEKVEIMVKPFPSEDNAPYQSLGQATLAGEDSGFQVWKMPVPPKFEAKAVSVRITDKNGDFQVWRSIGWTRSVLTLKP